MLRVCLLALLLTPIAAAQPLAEIAEGPAPLADPAALLDGIPPSAQEAGFTAPEALKLRLAIVVERQSDGGSCDGGGSDCSGADCSGADPSCDGGSDLDAAACVVLGGCALLTAGAGYGIWKLVQRRRGPNPDTLDGFSATAQALAEVLSDRFEIVGAPEADLTLTVRELGASRQGIGLGTAAERLELRARDRDGRPLAVDDGPIPSTRLVVAHDATLPERLHRLAAILTR